MPCPVHKPSEVEPQRPAASLPRTDGNTGGVSWLFTVDRSPYCLNSQEGVNVFF